MSKKLSYIDCLNRQEAFRFFSNLALIVFGVFFMGTQFAYHKAPEAMETWIRPAGFSLLALAGSMMVLSWYWENRKDKACENTTQVVRITINEEVA